MTTSSDNGMKHSVDQATEAYLQQLETSEKLEGTKSSEEYTYRPDTLDQLIKTHNLRIEGLNFYPSLDLMIVVLNNRRIMRRKLSEFKRLRNALLSDLEAYELSRYGVHWPALDESLSLKGFLQYEIICTGQELAA